MPEVNLALDGHVAIITLAAPERRNALTPAMALELTRACEEADANPEVGAVVVRGTSGYFCAGAHRDTLDRSGADPVSAENYQDLGAVYQAFARVGTLAAPTIAAVRGAAVGAGVNLALATDLRIVAHTARFIAGFLRIGLHPGGGHFVLAARTGGREAAAAMAVFGQEISGQRAAELGMAWEALPDDQVEPRAIELAEMAAADPELARLAIRSLRLELGPPTVPWSVALEAERGPQLWSLRRRATRGQASNQPL